MSDKVDFRADITQNEEQNEMTQESETACVTELLNIKKRLRLNQQSQFKRPNKNSSNSDLHPNSDTVTD